MSAAETTERKSRAAVWLAVTGIALPAVLLAAGALFTSNASFAKGYVSRQLSAQRITFPQADAMTAEDKKYPCLVKYAGQALTTGKQAECYANNFIGRHLKSVAGGQTFSEMRGIQNGLRAQITTAQANNDPALADLQRQLNEVNGKRQSLFEGESMRGMLLTSFGFSSLGEKAGQAATAANAGAGAAVVLTLIAVVVRAARRRPATVKQPGSARVRTPEPVMS